MARRERNHVPMDARRTETTGGMIADLIARGERKRENPSLKSDHGQNKCQEFQLIRVFGTDKQEIRSGAAAPSEPPGVWYETAHVSLDMRLRIG